MPERIVSPHDAAAQPLIERITQPLYDALTLPGTPTALPGSPVYWFVQPIGNAELNGVASKTPLHTNLETAGCLPNPRLFTIMGVSMTVSAFTSGDLAIASTDLFKPIDLLEDLKRIYYYSSYQLKVGGKEYINTPTINVPSNYGAEGCAIYDDSVAVEANLAMVLRDYFQSTGRHHAVVKKPITIAPMQTFRTHLYFDTGPDPFAIGGLNTPGYLSGTRRVWNFLHGELGREVQ